MTVNNKYNHINLDYLELMADGDNSMKKIMLDMLLEELPVELDKMKNLQASKDWEELANVSHKMKSTLAYVGNDTMTIANKTVEMFCKKMDNLEEIEALVETLESSFEKVYPELQAVNNAL